MGIQLIAVVLTLSIYLSICIKMWPSISSSSSCVSAYVYFSSLLKNPARSVPEFVFLFTSLMSSFQSELRGNVLNRCCLFCRKLSLMVLILIPFFPEPKQSSHFSCCRVYQCPDTLRSLHFLHMWFCRKSLSQLEPAVTV